jgi:hypothetical protein
LCQRRLVDPLGHRLPQHFHPFAVKMFEIARAMEDVAGAGGTNGGAQIEEASTLADGGGADQRPYGVALLGHTFLRVAGGTAHDITLDRHLRREQPVGRQRRRKIHDKNGRAR